MASKFPLHSAKRDTDVALYVLEGCLLGCAHVGCGFCVGHPLQTLAGYPAIEIGFAVRFDAGYM